MEGRLRAIAALAGASGACALMAAPAGAVSTLDLASDAPTRFLSTNVIPNVDGVGYAVGGGGDVNGDGVNDVLVGAPDAGLNNVGFAYVLFGLRSGTTTLTAPIASGFRIDGSATAGRAGHAVAIARDVNGDGRDDVLVGSPDANPNNRTYAGSVFVVFGKTSSTTVAGGFIGSPGGPAGFRIDGGASDSAGTSVAGAGDVNGDGLGDILVGAPTNDRAGLFNTGSAYVVFGKAGTATVDLSALGSQGYELRGLVELDEAGQSVANAGDVNGDGRPDQLVGAPNSTYGYNEGAAYVAFGKTTTSALQLGQLGSSGYTITGEWDGNEAGWSVDTAGDVNGDGRPDQLVGAPQANGDHEGAAYVVFGKTTTTPVNLDSFSGYEIVGGSPYEHAGESVAGLGDVNGDGVRDQVVGAPQATYNGRGLSGSAYVVYGRSATSPLALATFSQSQGYRIDGAAIQDAAGESVAGPANVAGDATRDVLIGSPHNILGAISLGSAHVVDDVSALEGPVMGSLSMSASVRLLASAGASSAPGAGGAIRYQLAKPARVTLRVARVLSGHIVRRPARRRRISCVRGAPPRRRPERACPIFVTVGQLLRTHRVAGPQSVPFAGRIGARRLAPGRYVLEALARDRQGRVHGPLRARFRVVR